MPEKNRWIDPPKLFLVVGLLVGVLYCILIPYGAGFDEERHLVRIYYMSQFQFLPNFPNPKIHEDVFDLSYQRRLVQTPASDMFSREYLERRFSTFDQLRYGQKTQSLYSPVIFLPQALIGRWLWWKYDFPILPTIILQRLAGLLIYIAGAYTAIRAVPYGKWIFTALSLLPAALYQAATLNADGFTVAVSFAFIGCVLVVYVNERDAVRPSSLWMLFALSLLLGFAKPGAIVLLPLLLLLARHPFPSRVWSLLLVAGALLAIAANIGWWLIATPGSVFSGGGVQSVSQQSSLIFSEPLSFIKLLLQGMFLTFPDQVLGLIAGYGYGAGQVPGPVYLLVALGLLAALLAEPRRVLIPVKTRMFLVVFFLFCSAAIYTAAFVPNYVTGGVLALIKHGRYYIPFAPLFFLGICGLVILRENLQRLAQLVAIGSILFSMGFYSFGIYAAYYTYCGYAAYTGGACTLPVYKNLEKEDAYTAAISAGAPVSQTFTSLCSGLELLQVFVKSVPADSAGSLKISLLDENHQVIASQEIPTKKIVMEDYLPLPITPPQGERNGNYEIQLEAVGLTSAEEITVLLTRTDYYPGQLVVNGATTRSDLLIHYTCTRP